MIRLMQTMAGAKHGGAEAFFVRLACALQDRPDAIHQTVAIRRDPARASALRQCGVETLELGFGGWFDWRTRPRLDRVVAGFRPNVVLSWMNRATRFTPDLAGRGVVHVARLGGYYDPKHYRRCDHLIANTRDIARWLVEQGFADDRVHYAPNFVSEAKASPVDRSGLATPDEAPVLLCLGRLHANKAFDVAIRALAQVPLAILWIAGEGPEGAALKTLAQDVGVAGRVRFLGWRDDAAGLIAAATLVLVPSRHEPLGNVVLEAWAQGAPVVAAASQGPAALIHDGADGRLAPIDDPTALAGAIRDCLADPGVTAAMVAAGRARVAAEFSKAAVVDRYLDLFRQVTERCAA